MFSFGLCNGVWINLQNIYKSNYFSFSYNDKLLKFNL